MKKLISLLLGLISLTAFSQSQPAPKTGGVALRVNDSTSYISTQTTAHSQGYGDIFWNNQATTPHYDIWDGSAYNHVFDFGGGGGGGTVTSVSGTSNRITSTGGATPVIDISASYVGQTSITTLGTISTGTVPGTLVSNTPAGNIAATTAQAAINELDDEKLAKVVNLNTQTTDYVAVLTDASKKVLMNSASSNTFTFPPNSSVAFPVGTRIVVTQIGAGVTSAVAGGGVTLNHSAPTLSISDQYASLVATKTATDTWLIENGTASGVTAAALTKVDDTNVTLTLGGTPSTALLQATSLTLGWTGTLGVSRGGTGANNTTQTYTPTLTNSANLAASTARQCTYFRVGNAVTVSGQVDIDPTTTATLTTLGISLPIASDFTTAFQAGGSAAASTVTDGAAAIFSDATNNRATLQYMCVDVTNHTMTFSFTYQVL